MQDVNLFSTTVVYLTGETAMVSNAAMVSSRIINKARSPLAIVFVFFKFSVDVEYEKIQIFDRQIRKFVRCRPREWVSFFGFRPTSIVADQGFVGKKRT